MAKFGTAINCMDGRVQLPVINYLMEHFDVEWIDAITEPGPCRILAENTDVTLVQSILNRLAISVHKHGSVGIAIVGHYDCAGNPASKKDQLKQIHQSIKLLEDYCDGLPVLGLWVDENWQVENVTDELVKYI